VPPFEIFRLDHSPTLVASFAHGEDRQRGIAMALPKDALSNPLRANWQGLRNL
jgi:hypothetical protein